MAYAEGATNVDNGLQQINIHSYQELTSLNANKLLLGMFEHGVYNAEVVLTEDPVDAHINILKGSTFLFEKTYESQKLVSKILLQDDAELLVPLDSLRLYADVTAFIVLASWSYNLINTANKYMSFQIVPYTTANLSEIETKEDLVVAVLLNHQIFLDNGGTSVSYYRVSYQNQKYRNVMKNTFNHMSNFPITFSQDLTTDAVTINVGEGHCILGDTYIHNKATLDANIVNGIWPIPIDTGSPETYNQIDVLRLKTERNDSGVNTPYLQWESFLKEKPVGGYNTVEEFIDGFDFVFEDIGYNLMFVVRDRNGLEATTRIWPNQSLIVNPLTPQVGIPETFSRFKIPVY